MLSAVMVSMSSSENVLNAQVFSIVQLAPTELAVTVVKKVSSLILMVFVSVIVLTSLATDVNLALQRNARIALQRNAVLKRDISGISTNAPVLLTNLVLVVLKLMVTNVQIAPLLLAVVKTSSSMLKTTSVLIVPSLVKNVRHVVQVVAWFAKEVQALLVQMAIVFLVPMCIMRAVILAIRTNALLSKIIHIPLLEACQ